MTIKAALLTTPREKKSGSSIAAPFQTTRSQPGTVVAGPDSLSGRRACCDACDIWTRRGRYPSSRPLPPRCPTPVAPAYWQPARGR